MKVDDTSGGTRHLSLLAADKKIDDQTQKAARAQQQTMNTVATNAASHEAPVVHLSSQAGVQRPGGHLYSHQGMIAAASNARTRVQMLKEQIQGGSYQVYSERVAEGLMSAVKTLLKRS